MSSSISSAVRAATDERPSLPAERLPLDLATPRCPTAAPLPAVPPRPASPEISDRRTRRRALGARRRAGHPADQAPGQKPTSTTPRTRATDGLSRRSRSRATRRVVAADPSGKGKQAPGNQERHRPGSSSTYATGVGLRPREPVGLVLPPDAERQTGQHARPYPRRTSTQRAHSGQGPRSPVPESSPAPGEEHPEPVSPGRRHPADDPRNSRRPREQGRRQREAHEHDG